MVKSCLMSAIAVERLLTRTYRTRIGVAHHVTALIFYDITRCYGKHVAAFAVAIAAGDIIKYQSFIYGSFVWGIHVRFINILYVSRYLRLSFLIVSTIQKEIIYFEQYTSASCYYEHNLFNPSIAETYVLRFSKQETIVTFLLYLRVNRLTF